MADPENIDSTPDHVPIRRNSTENDHNILTYFLAQDHLSLRDSDDTLFEPTPSRRSSRSHPLAKQESKKTYIDFVHGDPENPLNFSPLKKWFITVLVVVMTVLAAIAAGAYAVVTPDLIREFGCSSEIAILGVSLYPLGCTYEYILINDVLTNI
jgi:hypothetical protein